MEFSESDHSDDLFQPDNDGTYNVEAIIAEGEPHERGQRKYLVKWEGFPMDECTWEPPEHFDSPLILENWNSKRSKLTNNAFQKMVLTQILKYHKEYQKTHGPEVFNQFQTSYHPAFVELYQAAARERQAEKLAQKKTSTCGPSEGESSSDTPLIVQRKRMASGTAGDDTAQTSRKLPFQDSSSDSDVTTDSFMEELSGKPQGTDGPFAKKSSDLPKTPNAPGIEKNSSLAKSTTVKSLPAPRAGGTAVSTGISFSLKPKNPIQPLSMSKPAPPVVKPKAKLPPSGAPIHNPTPTLGKAKRSGAPPIRMVNRPKAASRKEWQNSTKHFTTLHYRAEAQKRATRDKTPDFGVLQFVGGAPSGITKDPHSRRDSNPYSLQSGGGYHDQAAHSNHDIRPRRQANDSLPHPNDLDLAPWEQKKVRLTCFEYRNGTCPRTAENCKFLHRQTSKVSPMNGNIPGKYRSPPITCFNWMKDPKGCTRSDDDCLFAHYNTGLLGEPGKPPRQIDATAQPAFMSRKLNTEARNITGKNSATKALPFVEVDYDSDRPPNHHSKLTCYYWMNKPWGCDKTSDLCRFAHWNTGWLGNLNGASPTKLDPASEPVSRQSRLDNNQPPPWNAPRHSEQLVSNHANHIPSKEKTCFFWYSEGTCDKSEAHCRFAHRYTPVIADPPPGYRPKPGRRPFHRNQSPAPSFGLEDDAMDISSPEERRLSIRSNDLSRVPPVVGPSIKAPQVGSPQVDAPPVTMLQMDRPQASISGELSSADMKSVIEEATKLNFQTIFAASDGKSLLSRRAFLFFHPHQHLEELELTTRWLLMHHVEVSNFWTDGSWGPFLNYVSRGGTGVILAHPDFEAFDQIRGFGQILRAKVNIWSVGYQPGIEHDVDISVGPIPFRFDCIPIFPHGGLIYITDDVFRDKPREALKIMKLFISKIERCRELNGPVDPWKRVDDGCLLWRLATRPELMDSIYRSIEKYADSIEAGDTTQTSRLELYALLTRTGYVEQDHAELQFRPDDYFPIMSERREFWPEYYEAITKGEGKFDKANDIGIRYYSEWLVHKRRDYRQFFVVHTEPNKPSWMKKHQSIDEVMTPEKCIRLLEQEGKGSKIDFLEWTFEEKEKRGRERERERE